MDYKKARKIVKELLDIDTNNAYPRIISDNVIKLWENDINFSDGEDIFVMPHTRIDSKNDKYVMFHDQLEIWRLDSDIVTSIDGIEDIYKESNSRYAVPRKYWQILYPENVAEKKAPVDETVEQLTIKDEVAIRLVVPMADTPWVNKMIREKLRRSTLPSTADTNQKELPF